MEPISEASSWTPEIEEYLSDILQHCKDSVLKHNKYAYIKKKRHIQIALPAALIPTCLAPLLGTFKEEIWCVYVSMLGMIVTALFSTVSTFFNYSEKSTRHFQYSGCYGDIVTDIEEILALHPAKRVSAAIVMRTMKLRYEQLQINSPDF